jgi:hypothetical protein
VDGNTFTFEDQELFIFMTDYELSPKYRVQFANAYDFAQNRNDRSTISLIRRFDRYFVSLGFRVDDFEDDTAVFVNVWPEGLAPGGGTQSLRGYSNK